MRTSTFCALAVLGTSLVACGGSRERRPCARDTPCSPALPSIPGEPDTSIETALPPVPAMVNVRALVTGDAVELGFDPVDGAEDYRVYVLPDDARITSDAAGHVTVQDGLYRCAGDRQTPETMADDEPEVQSAAIRTLVVDQLVQGHLRTLADATLGYVYTTPGPGRVPVYALGDPRTEGDNACYFARWTTSRVKRYVTDTNERATMLAARWRDDGVVFYAPEPSAGTVPVRETDDADRARLFYVDGAEATLRGDGTVAFHVLATRAEGTEPLMRVYYHNACGDSHDELVPSMSRFARARYQGDQLPEYALHWSGITEETVLVVEALEEGCPYEGLIAPMSLAPHETNYGWDYQPWFSIDELRANSPTGEVFINGQHEDVGTPRPLARSFVRVSPAPISDLDFFAGFGPGESMGTFVDVPCGVENCWAQHRQTSERFDIHFFAVEPGRYAFVPTLGELWVGYADVGADVDGKIRITPTTTATMASDTYLYATMEVTGFTTARRYPQILISDQPAPVQNTMAGGNTLVIQTFSDWPPTFEVQVCDHVMWNVNAQCPTFDLHTIAAPSDPEEAIGLYPNAEVGEHLGLDRATRMEVYASTDRVYLFLDSEPYGCVELSNAGVPSGTSTVTFGDVLYHSGVDGLYDYSERALRTDSQRHFDNLGFRSGVAAPTWDFERLPCATHISP